MCQTTAFMKAASNAVLPWNSLDAQSDMPVQMGGCLTMRKGEGDSQEQIDYCLFNCPYPECCNCLGGGKQCRPGRPRKVRVTISE